MSVLMHFLNLPIKAKLPHYIKNGIKRKYKKQGMGWSSKTAISFDELNEKATFFWNHAEGWKKNTYHMVKQFNKKLFSLLVKLLEIDQLIFK